MADCLVETIFSRPLDARILALFQSAAARQILVLLQEVMASRNSAQAKLNKVVEIIGQSLSSEVCSIYLVREGVLELFATRGLKQEAVHVTRMAMGEGLVGLIATNVETLNLDEAAAHPDFSYRPETGEDRFHSFAGVPIVRRERSIGVLCVQHVEPRRYEEVEIEALQTVAMVLSELIANAELADDGPADARVAETGTTILQGLQLVMGMARGHAVFHQPRIHVEHTVAEDTEAERARVISAFAKMREQIDRMTGAAEFGTEGEHQEVLETYKMFAYDEGWIRRINEAIDSGLTAEAAIERVQQRTRMRMRQIDDPLLQDRMHDLEDMANRLLRIVSGQLGTAAQLGLRQDAILIARNLGPAELLEYDRRRLKGVILEEGSLTAHVTIVARAMGVPVLGRVRDVRHKLNEGDLILLDVAENTVLIRPGPDMDEAFENKLHVTQKRRAEFAAMRDLPSVTTDGQRVELMVNAGLREDAQALDLVGADGIGLFRTEFQFLVSATLPQREKQQRLYKDVLDAAGDRPVIFRTVDIGGARDADVEDHARPPLRHVTDPRDLTVAHIPEGAVDIAHVGDAHADVLDDAGREPEIDHVADADLILGDEDAVQHVLDDVLRPEPQSRSDRGGEEGEGPQRVRGEHVHDQQSGDDHHRHTDDVLQDRAEGARALHESE